jgi:hypothetical protein
VEIVGALRKPPGMAMRYRPNMGMLPNRRPSLIAMFSLVLAGTAGAFGYRAMNSGTKSK